MTDIKEPINTTSDGTFLSVVCENTKKVLLAKSWGGYGPPSPPRNNPPGLERMVATAQVMLALIKDVVDVGVVLSFKPILKSCAYHSNLMF